MKQALHVDVGMVWIALATVAGAPAAAQEPPEQTLVSQSDARVTRIGSPEAWTIQNDAIALSVGRTVTGDFVVQSIRTPAGAVALPRSEPDASLTVAGRRTSIGSPADGYVLTSVTGSTRGLGVQMDVAFNVRALALRVTRSYAVYPRSPIIEAWTSVQNLSTTARRLSDLEMFRLHVPSGSVSWITGLSGDNAATRTDASFTARHVADPVAGSRLTFGSNGRSSEQVVPIIAIESSGVRFVAGVMWSAAWSMTVDPVEPGVMVAAALPGVATAVAPGQTLELPHGVFGVHARSTAPAAGLYDFIVDGLRGGRGFEPLVAYNTWYAYGTTFTDAEIRDEMAQQAALGVELFVLDAGWYAGTGTAGQMDFSSGLGNWTPDPARFPDGLSGLRDYAHALGMKFGLWVEPERVALETVGVPGLAQSDWLATRGGSYGTDYAAQICLADEAAARWVFDELVGTIDAVRPDYLKWDNNFWIDCDRTDHGHGPADGGFHHVRALYRILDALRERYPDLLIENSAGGGSRLDLAMIARTDAGWMDDGTAPSVHVRHNLEGLARFLPPAYLLSWVTNHWREPLQDAPDAPLYFRSRMPGALGICFRAADLDQDDRAAVANQLAAYKAIRSRLRRATAKMLTGQAMLDGGPSWDEIEETSTAPESVTIFAFEDATGAPRVVVHPRGLRPDVRYDVVSLDAGELGVVSGADLMTDGIEIGTSPVSASHVLLLDPLLEFTPTPSDWPRRPHS